MDPNIWGPHAWIFLHTITLTYPHKPTTQDKINYKNFFINLGKVLPCPHCNNNYNIHLNQLPIDEFLTSKKSLVYWLIQIHNLTNNVLNKKNNISFDEFTDIYKNLYQKKTNISQSQQSIQSPQSYSNIFFIIFIIFIILLIIFFIFQKSIKAHFYNCYNSFNNLQTNII
tara:strand:- start:298 stop:807 length:510 start_codon:yes stop_codon:yes gene_type:complete